MEDGTRWLESSPIPTIRDSSSFGIFLLCICYPHDQKLNPTTNTWWLQQIAKVNTILFPVCSPLCPRTFQLLHQKLGSTLPSFDPGQTSWPTLIDAVAVLWGLASIHPSSWNPAKVPSEQGPASLWRTSELVWLVFPTPSTPAERQTIARMVS